MKPLLAFLFFLLLNQTSLAQRISRSTLSAFGGSAQTDGLYLSHTAGQGSVHTQTQMNGITLHQGFEQAFSLYAEGNRSAAIQVRVYPNPNNGQFSIATDLGRDVSYDMALFDAMGRIVHREQLSSGIPQHVTLSNEVSPGSYTLRITTADGFTGVCKIIVN
jgi:hypothetical protein